MNTLNEILSILDEVLVLNGRSAAFNENTPLLGALPELDSMAVVALIAQMEERLGLTILDDEIDGTMFATVGALASFVDSKLRAA